MLKLVYSSILVKNTQNTSISMVKVGSQVFSTIKSGHKIQKVRNPDISLPTVQLH